MQRSQPVVGHQDFHLANGQVLDVLVLGASFLDVGFAAESDRLVPVLKYSLALNGQGAPLLPYARRCLEEILRCLLVFGAQEHVGIWR